MANGKPTIDGVQRTSAISEYVEDLHWRRGPEQWTFANGVQANRKAIKGRQTRKRKP